MNDDLIMLKSLNAYALLLNQHLADQLQPQPHSNKVTNDYQQANSSVCE